MTSRRPLPAAVYWRRRLLIVAVLIGVVGLVLRFVAGGDDDAAPTATPTPATTSAPAPVDGTFDVALTVADTACDPQLVRVTPTVASDQPVRGAVKIGLVVSSTEATSCTLQPADAELIAIISANDTPIWDSTVCKTSLLTEPVQLSAQWSTVVAATWSGRGSGITCNGSEDWATPGRYLLQVGTLGGEPGEAGFTLAARPKASPAPSAAPSASPSPQPTPSD